MSEHSVSVTGAASPRTTLSALKLVGMFVGPIVLLALVIVVFLNTSSGLRALPVPVEILDIERVQVVADGFRVTIRNTGQDPVTIAQVAVDDAYWPATVQPSPTLSRLAQATVVMSYPWVEGETHTIDVLTAHGLKFGTVIPVAFESPKPTQQSLLGFTLIGVYVGVIPVFLGLMWYPALRRLGQNWMGFLLSLTVGLLIFLGAEAVAESLDLSARIAGPFQGIGLVTIGAVVTFLLLEAITQQQAGSQQRKGVSSRLTLAYMVALGIGLHNLGEGLAIGAAYVVGEVSLGAFLVVGFIIQNITEGLGIIAPVLRDRPAVRHLLLMGLLGGAPAIAGAWIGGFSYSTLAATLFLSVGAGAIFVVVYQVAKLMRGASFATPPMVAFSGVTTGLLLMYVTGLLVK